VFRVPEMKSSNCLLAVAHVSEQTNVPFFERAAQVLQSAMPQ